MNLQDRYDRARWYAHHPEALRWARSMPMCRFTLRITREIDAYEAGRSRGVLFRALEVGPPTAGLSG